MAQQDHSFPETFLPTTVLLIVDTGASISITNNLRDFISTPTPVQPTTLKGIASGLAVKAIGTTRYILTTDNGAPATITLPHTLYVPDCAMRLLCPRHMAATTGYPEDGFISYEQSGVLRYNGDKIPVSYHNDTCLPIVTAKIITDVPTGPNATSLPNHASLAAANSIPSTKPNLTNSQRLKLLWHERCNHRSMATINSWIRRGLLPIDPSVASAPDPVCAACQAGKAHRKPHAGHTNSIAAPCTFPGQAVSADQLEAGSPGKIPTTKGLPTTRRYRYCNLWIDHFSRFVFPTFHETKAASELVASKREFQNFAARYNIKIKKIRADNGVYAAGQFQVSCEEDGQDLTFCAVGGHWQNGVAERHIGVVTQTARTLLLHAISLWPNVLSEEFWPFAVRHACTFHNSSIDPGTQKSPHHLFTGEPAPWRLQDFRVFGCPVFVLDKRLQDGDSLPKWRSRCWTGVYVGQSLQHAGNVPLVFNPITTHVSPQFHVTFDDQFTTISGTSAVLSDADYARLYDSSDWLFKNSFSMIDDLYLFETFWADPPRDDIRPRRKVPKTRYTKRLVNPSITEETTKFSDEVLLAKDTARPDNTFPTGARADASETADAGANADASIIADAGVIADASDTADASKTTDAHNNFVVNSHGTPYINLRPMACSAALRDYQALHGLNVKVYIAESMQPSSPLESSVPEVSSFENHLLQQPNPEPGPTPVSLTASDNKQDILTQGQMFKAPDAEKFIACQVDEITSLYDLDIMESFPITTLPSRARLLSSIWSYRRKRLPNGVLSKYKSRLCVNGKEQAFGRDYWETYAPVAAWSTIRLLLYLSTILNLKTRQVDYTSAFPQADLDVPVYMRVPQGWYVAANGKLAQHDDARFQDKTHYLKLKKNLYGCKQAARNWFRKLTEGLKKEGFVQSATDTCLFLRHDCLIVVYVDDCLFFSPNSTTIDCVIQSLSKTFKLKDEGDVSAFLGVQIQKDTGRKIISFTQPGLIEQVIRDVGITSISKGKDTPVDCILHADVDGPSRVETWNFRSVIGKLNYLANNTRPDISMAVHQCARYCSAPRALHELAVKRIVRYLLATRSKGLTLRPTPSLALDMFVDADFAGRWHREYSHLRDSTLSRTGYVITFCGCPISWASKLQSEIALSTTESEYIALSSATRELLPLRRILQDIVTNSFIRLPPDTTGDTISTSSFSTTIKPSNVYEDNSACIVLATTDSNFKPRTKHISLKFHHFQDHVRNGNLRILKVNSEQNWADIFTKPLGRVKFEKLRQLLMGW